MQQPWAILLVCPCPFRPSFGATLILIKFTPITCDIQEAAIPAAAAVTTFGLGVDAAAASSCHQVEIPSRSVPIIGPDMNSTLGAFLCRQLLLLLLPTSVSHSSASFRNCRLAGRQSVTQAGRQAVRLVHYFSPPILSSQRAAPLPNLLVVFIWMVSSHFTLICWSLPGRTD
jgi:hypothetical protein